jgi:hypothetical protein
MFTDLKRLQAGERITTESFNALVDAVQTMRRTATSFPLEAHRSPAGLQISLAAQPKWELLELDEDVAAFDKDKRAKRLGYKPEEEDDKWIDVESDAKSVSDAQAALYLEGERRFCHFHPAAGRYVPVEAFQWHLGVLDEDLAAAGAATVSVWRMEDDGSFVDSDLDVVAYDWLLTAGKKLPSGSRVVVQLLVHARKWIVTQAAECPEEI